MGYVEDRERQQRVGGVQMLTPIPVDGLVLAEFEIAYQPEFEQGVDGQQNPPLWIDALRATAYILNSLYDRTIRRA